MGMPKPSRQFFEFGPFRLDAAKHRLLRDGEPVHLSPKSAKALTVLVQNAGKLLEREALMQALWADTFVEDANLTVAISHLRKALGQHGETEEYIETIPRVGYRFVAEVREAYEEPRPLIIEKHTQSRTVIEEEMLPDFQPVTESVVVRETSSLAGMLPVAVNRRFALIAAGTILVLALGSFLYFRRGNEGKATASNLAASGIRSIAVLPPKSFSSESENPALSLGIADALITRLGGIHKLAVRPTSAVARYVGANQDPLNAGRALGVDAVLDGTLQREHGRMRVTLRLLNVVDGSQLWAGTFDEADADIFKLQDSISRQVGNALYSDLSRDEKTLLTKRQTSNAEAYALYLKGNYFWNKRGNEVAKSVEYLRKAIELDPSFAQAYATLAAVDATGGIPSPEAELLIEKALNLDNNLAEAHATYGFIRMFHHWDWAAAESELDRAIELNPNSVAAHHWKGVYLSLRGRLDEAKAEMHRALDLDPQSLIVTADIGQLHYFAHEYDQAIEYCNRALAIDNSFFNAHVYLRDTYQMKGMDQEFFEEMTRTASPADRAKAQSNFAQAGRKGLLLGELKRPENARQTLHMVWLSASVGDKENTLEYLNRVFQERTAGAFVLPFINVDPLFDFLRDDPRFKEILHRMNLP